jgi:hypothetical protein
MTVNGAVEERRGKEEEEDTKAKDLANKSIVLMDEKEKKNGISMTSEVGEAMMMEAAKLNLQRNLAQVAAARAAAAAAAAATQSRLSFSVDSLLSNNKKGFQPHPGLSSSEPKTDVGEDDDDPEDLSVDVEEDDDEGSTSLSPKRVHSSPITKDDDEMEEDDDEMEEIEEDEDNERADEHRGRLVMPTPLNPLDPRAGSHIPGQPPPPQFLANLAAAMQAAAAAAAAANGGVPSSLSGLFPPPSLPPTTTTGMPPPPPPGHPGGIPGLNPGLHMGGFVGLHHHLFKSGGERDNTRSYLRDRLSRILIRKLRVITILTVP